MPETTFFALDLDGTVTTRELLPAIAAAAGLEPEIARLTRLTLSGTIPFPVSFRLRFALLRRVPLPLVWDAVRQTPLEPRLVRFIAARPDRCALVTGNLDVWIAPVAERLGCRVFCSRSARRGNALRLRSILDKADAARALRREGWRVVAVGDGLNDLPLFQEADFSVAFAGVHAPPAPLRRLAHAQARDAEELCALLEALERAPEPRFRRAVRSLSAQRKRAEPTAQGRGSAPARA